MKTKITVKISSILITLGLSFLLIGNLHAEVKIGVIDSGSTEQVYKSISFTSIPANRDPINHGTKIVKLIRNANLEAKIYMLQVCEKQGSSFKPSAEGMLKAIKWCENNNIDIVNLSLVIQYNQKIEEAIRHAYYNKGIIFIAAAGNNTILNQFALNSKGYVCYYEFDKRPMFPASCDFVISVGAKEIDGKIADYSKVVVDVFSTGDYYNQKGTSFACARVTGIASKILTSNPNISLEVLKNNLKKQKNSLERNHFLPN